MNGDQSRTRGPERPSSRRLAATLLAGILTFAGPGLLAGCSPAGSEPIRPTRAAAGDREGVAAGKELFEQQCASCHGVSDGPPKLGPSLEGVLRRERLHVGRPATEPVVREIILEGSGAMRPFRDALTDTQLDALMSYLETL